jgi:hypothetical protein
MSASFRIEGLAEMIAALKRLPAELAEEAVALVEEAATEAEDEIVAAYPEVSGDLKGGVRHTTRSSRFGTIARVSSNAPHAFIYETGTASRQTDLGYNRGPMPGKKIFVPTMMRHRRELEQELAALLRRAGFEVIEVHGVGSI